MDRNVRLITVRAISGHSIAGITPEAVGAKPLSISDAPDSMVHGTRIGYLSSIIRDGILAGGRTGQRNDVHMSNMDPLFFPDKVRTKELPGFRSTSEMLVLVSQRELLHLQILYETRAGAFVFSGNVPGSAIQCAVRLPERTVSFWGEAWKTMDKDLANALYYQKLPEFIENRFGSIVQESKHGGDDDEKEEPDRTTDMGKKELDDDDDELHQEPPAKVE